MATSQLTLTGFTDKGRQLFTKRTQQLVGAFNQRLQKRGFTDSHLSLADARNMFAAAVGTACLYCQNRLTIMNLSPDHIIPLSRGGDPIGIQIICNTCNREKGELTHDEYVQYLHFLKTMSPEAQRYIHRVMRAGAAFPALQAKIIGMGKRKNGGQSQQQNEANHAGHE